MTQTENCSLTRVATPIVQQLSAITTSLRIRFQSSACNNNRIGLIQTFFCIEGLVKHNVAWLDLLINADRIRITTAGREVGPLVANDLRVHAAAVSLEEAI